MLFCIFLFASSALSAFGTFPEMRYNISML